MHGLVSSWHSELQTKGRAREGRELNGGRHAAAGVFLVRYYRQGAVGMRPTSGASLMSPAPAACQRQAHPPRGICQGCRAPCSPPRRMLPHPNTAMGDTLTRTLAPGPAGGGAQRAHGRARRAGLARRGAGRRHAHPVCGRAGARARRRRILYRRGRPRAAPAAQRRLRRDGRRRGGAAHGAPARLRV